MLCRHLHTPIGEVFDMHLDQFDVLFEAMVAILNAEAPKQ